MPSVLGGKRNTKVFILYLLQNIQIPVTYVTLNDMIMETDYVMYLDFAECFYELLDNALIVAVGEEDGQPTYTVSPQGKHVAQQLHSDLLPVVLDESLRCALRYLDFKRRGVKTECSVRANPDGSAEFSCSMQEQGRQLCSTTIHCDCLARAQQMERNFRERPEAVYKGLWALLSGNVNCLFS
ncbi:MAG: DUF4364 family protein [Clostridia bacterium]|nr:DUF4364 family protein [Clostridia bacterium]